MRVALCVPFYGTVSPEFAIAWGNLVAFTQREGVLAGICTTTTAYVDRARNALVRMALDLDPTHLFFCDQDVVLPPETVMKLLAHGRSVVGVAYRRRTPPHELLVYEPEPFRIVEPPEGDLVEVPGLPMGATLVSAEVFRCMAEPWFVATLDQGEDVGWCARVRAMGVSLWCDRTIEAGHVGLQVVR